MVSFLKKLKLYKKYQRCNQKNNKIKADSSSDLLDLSIETIDKKKLCSQPNNTGKSRKRLLLNNDGFSMLELLLYVSIVGVIITIAVPKYEMATAMANTVKIQGDLQAINTAIAMYQLQNGEDPTKLADVADYVKNIDSVKPPTGNYIDNSGSTQNITDEAYSITVDGDDVEATLGENNISAFGKRTS